MAEIYIDAQGVEHSKDFLNTTAQEVGLTLDELIEQEGLSLKSTDPVKETAVVGSENQAVDTDSILDAGFLDSLDEKIKVNAGKKRKPLDIKSIQLKAAGRMPGQEIDLERPQLEVPDTVKQKVKQRDIEIQKPLLQNFRSTVKGVLTNNGIYKLGVEGKTIQDLINNGVEDELIKRVKENYKYSYALQDLPRDSQIMEIIIDEELAKAIKQENDFFSEQKNKTVATAKQEGLYRPAIDKGFSDFMQDLDRDEQKLAALTQEAKKYRRTLLKSKDPAKIQDAENNLIRLKPLISDAFETMQQDKYGMNRKKYSYLFDPTTGAKLGAAEAAESNNVADYTKEVGKLTQEYKNLDEELLEREFFRHNLDMQNISERLNQTIDLVPKDGMFALNLGQMGYTPENGVFKNVKFKDLMNYRNTEFLQKSIYNPKGDIVPVLKTELNDIASDRLELGLEREALKNSYVLNIDPASIKLNASDYIERFGETVLEASLGESVASTIGTSKRKELDQLENLFNNANINITEEQKKNFERGFGMKVTEGVGYFVPELAKFALANKVAGAAGITRYIAQLAKSGSRGDKIMANVLGALLEEAKFEAVTAGEAKTLGGAGFFLGGKLAGKLIPKFSGNMAAFNNVIEKYAGGAIGGVGGAETAKIAEAAFEDLIGNKDFKSSIKELYGDMDEATEQMLVDGVVFGLLGVQRTKAKDFTTINRRKKLLEDLDNRISAGEFKGKELEKKLALAEDLQRDIDIADREFNKQNIGAQKAQANKAKQILQDPEASSVDKRNAQKYINKYEANIAAAKRKINRQISRFKEAGVIGKDVNVIITEGKEFAPGGAGENRAVYDPFTNTVKIDILQHKPGVFAEEIGHAFAYAALRQSPEAAKVIKNKIQTDVNEALKDKTFTVNGKKDLTFEQAIKEAYPELQRPEEYVMNVVNFLSEPGKRAVLLETGVIKDLQRGALNIANRVGLDYTAKKNFTTGAQVLEFLFSIGKVAEGGSVKAIKDKFRQFENMVIDGRKLKDFATGKEILSEEGQIKEMQSVKIEESTKKDVFSKAEKMYEEYKDNMSNAGLMVGMEFEPIVRKMTNKYRDLYGMDQATMDNIVTDVMIETRPGYNGIPDLVKTWDPSKGASLTSHIYGNLPKRILGIIQRKYPDLGKTVALETEKAEKLTTEEGFGGGGFVDVSSPETYTRVSQKKAEATMGMSEAYSKKAAEVGEKILMTTKLQDLDAKSVGTIKSAEGETLRVAMLEGNKARVTKPDGTTEVIPARSPKVVEQKYGAPEKSFKKVPTTKDQMVADAKDFLIPEMEKEAGGLKDNYTPTPEYESFVDRTFPLFKDYISQSAVNKRFADLKEPVIDPATGKQKREKTAVGKAIFTKKNITLAEWRKYFIGDGKMRIDGRRRSLLETLATEQGFDKVMETLGNESLRKQIESRQEDLNVDLVDNYVAVMAKSLDRNNPTIMASKVIEEVSKRTKREQIYIQNALYKAIEDGTDNILNRLPEDIRLEFEQVVIDQLRSDLRNQFDNITEQVNDITKNKINVSKDFDVDKIKPLHKQTKAEIDNSIKIAEKIAELLPKELSTLTSGKSTKLSYRLIADLFGYTSRVNYNAKTKFVRSEKTSKQKEGIENIGFEQVFGDKFGSKHNELSEGLLKEWSEWNSSLKGQSLGYDSTVFLNKVNEIADNATLNIKQKEAAVKKLPEYDLAVKDQIAKDKFLNLLLKTIGEASKNLNAKELRDFAYGVSPMLLNNDGTGIRNFSSLKYIDLAANQGKRSNEHLQSKAEFAARVLEAIESGTLTPEKVKELTSGYNSEISSKAGQKMSDKVLGRTIENAAYLKMAAESIVNKELKNFNIESLNNKYNWITGKSALTELIDAEAIKINNEILKADKELNKGTETVIGSVGNNNTTTMRASKLITLDNAIKKAKDPNKVRKGISVFDFDDTLARTKSNVLYTMPNGKRDKLNAEQFAKRGDELLQKGAEFDFSEFSKVVKAELGPLFKEAQKKAGKFTTKDIFVLTARPAASAKAIRDYLKSEGLDIPFENITGLGDSRAEAKAEWMTGKVAEGYNDFYFADDAIKNVKAVKQALDLFDVKSDVQQAIMASKNIKLDQELANMIERKKGISATEPMSAAMAANIGRKKGKFDLFLPPNAEDFAGLMYKLYGKGKQGNADMELIREKILKPYNRGEQAISTYKQNLAEDYKSIEKQLGNIEGTVTAETKADLKELNFNADQAVRVALWNQAGIEVPGITNLEAAKLRRIVLKDPRLRAYADGVKAIVKGDIFEPGETWFSSNIRYDLFKHATEGVRGKFLEEWQTNMDAMFTPENFNRMEAAYGTDYVRNLKDMIDRMKTGRTRSKNIGKEANAALDYINGSVGVIMWVNTRSAMLQTISSINYLNWTDNNPLAVAKTLAKPKEFAKTFVEIFNSDFLKQRRSGLEINVEEAEIAKAVERSRGKARYLFDALIKMGFKPTQIADSFAIAAGGTPFYMNRTGTYVRKGFELAEAKKKAFEDLRELSEENQQSSRMDRVSNIQTGLLGRLVFAFNNTPFQMTRLQKKAALDLINQRGDWKTNVSKMVYYSTIQSLIFYALQQGTALTLFGKDDEDLTPTQKENIDKYKNKKVVSMANSMLDSFLAGSGFPGKILVTGKNTLSKYLAESKKGYQADYGNVINEALSISPPLSSKTKKAYSAFKQFKFGSTKKGQAELAKYGEFDALNPTNVARAKIFSAVTNVPVDRMLKKIENLDAAYNTENLSPQIQLALILGWDKWSLGFYDGLYGDDAEEELLSPEEKKEKRRAEKIKKMESLSVRERDSLRFLEMQKKYKK